MRGGPVPSGQGPRCEPGLIKALEVITRGQLSRSERVGVQGPLLPLRHEIATTTA